MAETDEAALESYRQAIRNLIEANSTYIMNNSMPSHASVIIAEFIRAAKHKVLALCNGLSDTVWGDRVLLEEVEKAIGRGVEFRVVTTEDASSSKFMGKMRNCGKLGRVSRFRDSKISHFVVVDDRMFRLEKDADRRTAIACANDQATATELCSLFDAIASLSSPALPA